MLQNFCIIQTMKSRTAALISIILFTSLAISCTESDSSAAASDSIERPDMEFSQVAYSLGRSEFPPVKMRSSTMQLFEDEHLAVLYQVTFEQKDSEGKTIMTGSCSSANIDTDTYQAVLSGKVSIDRPLDELSIQGEDITWYNDQQKISTDKSVVLQYDSGSEIRGTGLTCDFRTSEFEFDRITEGRLEP